MTSRRKNAEHLVHELLKSVENNCINGRPCRFNQQEMTTLLHMFGQFHNSSTQKMERKQFRDEICNRFQITDDFLIDRIFHILDKGSKGFLQVEDFVCGMSTFLVGELADKTKYCFQVYDLNHDGYITREEMFHLLKATIIKQSQEEDHDEELQQLVETALQKLDVDQDGRISFADFKQAVLNENLLLECLGHCLPSEDIRKSFLNILHES